MRTSRGPPGTITFGWTDAMLTLGGLVSTRTSLMESTTRPSLRLTIRRRYVPSGTTAPSSSRPFQG
jgi:hypothetical protein